MSYPYESMENVEYNTDLQELNFTANSDNFQLNENELNIQNTYGTVNHLNQQLQQNRTEQQTSVQQKYINQHNYMEQQRCIQKQKLMQQQKVMEERNTIKEQNSEKKGDIESGIADHEKHEEVVNNDVEMKEEENCITQLGFNDAEHVIREKSKQIILAKEGGKTMLSILNQQIYDIVEDISFDEKLIDEMKSQAEIARKNVEISDNEVSSLRERSNAIEEIVGKLEDMIKTLKNRFQVIESRNAKLTGQSENQRKEIDSFKKKADLRLLDLKKKIDDGKASISGDNPYENKNAILLNKIAEGREYCNKLEGHIQDLKSTIGAKDMQEMQRLLEEKQYSLTKIKQDQKQMKVEGEKNIQRLKESTDKCRERLKESEQKKDDVNTELETILKSIESEMKCITEEEIKNLELENQLREMEENIANQKSALNNILKDFNDKESLLLEKMKASQACLLDFNREKDELNKTFEALSKEFTSKMDIKNKLLLEKFDLEKKILKDETVKANLKTLEEEYDIAVEKEKSIKDKLRNLEEDSTLQTLTKEKVFLEASKVYSSEKLQNCKIQFENENADNKKMKYEINSILKKIEEKTKIIENLDQKIKSMKNKDTSMDKRSGPAGILKATPNVNPISPKKVKFLGVSSQSSSSISTEKPNSVSGKKTFDELMEEFQKSEKLNQAARKRKFEID